MSPLVFRLYAAIYILYVALERLFYGFKFGETGL